jgi:hypothetical protein
VTIPGTKITAPAIPTPSAPAGGSASGGSGGSAPGNPGAGLKQTIGQLLGLLSGGSSSGGGRGEESGASGRARRQPDPAAPQLPPGAVKRSRQQSAWANPVLVGAVTVLAVIVAVFLAYDANEGLPFVPTKELKVDIADGSNLVAGNDVREGGYRIGFVSDLQPIELANGTVGAQLTLKLDEANSSVPVDSTVEIRPRSVLGLKDMFVELNPGTASAPVANPGFTIPVSNTLPDINLDEVFASLDADTRAYLDLLVKGPGRVCRDTATISPVCSSASSPRTGTSRVSTRRWPCAARTCASS